MLAGYRIPAKKVTEVLLDNAKALFQFLSIFFLIRGVKQEPGEISVFHIQYNMKRVIP